MAIKPHNRRYDIVVYGATGGYTGKLVAEHIAKNLPTNLRWAVAGRNRSKLSDVIAKLRQFDTDRMPPIIEVVDDPATLSALAAQTRVMIATVGPYLVHGEAAFSACVEHGTHYLDVSGETAFVARMIAKYSARTSETGTVAISQMGVESMPADVLTWALARFARREFDAELGHVSFSMDLNDEFSGGSVASVLELLGNVPLSELMATHKPYALSPVRNANPAKEKYPLPALLGVRSIPHLGIQTMSIFGTTDAAIVWRTWGLMQTLSGGEKHDSRHYQPYGPRFSFSETAPCGSYINGMARYLLLILVGTLITASSLFRAFVRWVLFKPGEGRSREVMKTGSGTFKAVGEVVGGRGDGKTILAQARYDGSAYEWTGVFVAQAAMVLLEGEQELPGGVLTPACLGQPYIDRLRAVGLGIDVDVL